MAKANSEKDREKQARRLAERARAIKSEQVAIVSGGAAGLSDRSRSRLSEMIKQTTDPRLQDRFRALIDGSRPTKKKAKSRKGT